MEQEQEEDEEEEVVEEEEAQEEEDMESSFNRLRNNVDLIPCTVIIPKVYFKWDKVHVEYFFKPFVYGLFK